MFGCKAICEGVHWHEPLRPPIAVHNYDRLPLRMLDLSIQQAGMFAFAVTTTSAVS